MLPRSNHMLVAVPEKRKSERITEETGMAGQLLGFVGVGRMGGPMASRLLDAGYRLCVYDVSEEATRPLVARGAQLAQSPAEVASTRLR